MDKIRLYKMLRGWSPFGFYLAINITNRCNRTCSFCPYHSEYIKDNYHTRWFMSQPSDIDVNKIAYFLYRIRIWRRLIKHIAITGKGEPTMHPDWTYLCDTINHYGIKFSLTTNGDYYTQRMHDYLCGLKHFTGTRISVYSMAHYMNVSRIKGDRLTFFNQSGHSIPGISDGFITANFGIDHPRALKDFNTDEFCTKPFSFLTINTDGSVVPCYSYATIGHLYDSIFTLWNGRKIREFRRNKYNADCKNCGVHYDKTNR